MEVSELKERLEGVERGRGELEERGRGLEEALQLAKEKQIDFMIEDGKAAEFERQVRKGREMGEKLALAEGVSGELAEKLALAEGVSGELAEKLALAEGRNQKTKLLNGELAEKLTLAEGLNGELAAKITELESRPPIVQTIRPATPLEPKIVEIEVDSENLKREIGALNVEVQS
jgi:hypothetical protein